MRVRSRVFGRFFCGARVRGRWRARIFWLCRRFLSPDFFWAARACVGSPGSAGLPALVSPCFSGRRARGRRAAPASGYAGSSSRPSSSGSNPLPLGLSGTVLGLTWSSTDPRLDLYEDL